MEVTTLEQLKIFAQGQVVELPPFAEDQPFVARLRRPSLLKLIESGDIPNPLLSTANSLFLGESPSPKNKDSMSDLVKVLKILCEAAFIEPSWSDLESVGLTLSDDQLMAVFNYTQQGVKALDSFRGKSGHKKPSSNVSKV